MASSLELCPTWAPLLGFSGAMSAPVFACVGSAYGTGKAALGISTVGVDRPDVCGCPPLRAAQLRPPLPPARPPSAQIVMKNIIPIVMAGVLGIYGLIIAVIIGNAVTPPEANGNTKYSSFSGFAHLAGGLACGLSGMAAGIAIGIVGDAGVRASAQQAKLYVGMVLILIFAEALGLYGLIVGLILSGKEGSCP